MSIFCRKVSELFGLTGEEVGQLIEDCNENASPGEARSWRKSLPKLIGVLQRAGLGNLYLTAEYLLPAGGRIDATLIGDSASGEHIALIVELKQWSRNGIEYTEAYGFPAFKILAEEPYISGHPIDQTKDYEESLNRNLSCVVDGSVAIKSCQYLHEFESQEKAYLTQGLFAALDATNMFCSGEEEQFVSFLCSIFAQNHDNEPTKDIFMAGHYETTEIDMEIINQITESPENIDLWHDQKRIMNDVRVLLERQSRGELNGKYMTVISGAAGTGKTIIGFRILAEYWMLHRNAGNVYNCVYTLPRSRTIKQVLDGMCDDDQGIKPVFLESLSVQNRDLIVIDEAHRITNFNETGQRMNAAQIVIILQDDNQRVLGNEVGTLQGYYTFARNNGFVFTRRKLDYQKRSGLGSYVDRIDKLLYGTNYQNDTGLGIEVTVCDTIEELSNKVEDYHVSDRSVKYYAPYCWEWVSRRNPGAMDIHIPDRDHPRFVKQWNPWDYQYRWYLDSIDKVGCIYTAQGLGFNYVGLIWWDDLVWRTDHWEFNIGRVTQYDSLLRNSLRGDQASYNYLLLNIYRVLLTRAKKGIAIWFADEETREHFKTEMQIR